MRCDAGVRVGVGCGVVWCVCVCVCGGGGGGGGVCLLAVKWLSFNIRLAAGHDPGQCTASALKPRYFRRTNLVTCLQLSTRVSGFWSTASAYYDVLVGMPMNNKPDNYIWLTISKSFHSNLGLGSHLECLYHKYWKWRTSPNIYLFDFCQGASISVMVTILLMVSTVKERREKWPYEIPSHDKFF